MEFREKIYAVVSFICAIGFIFFASTGILLELSHSISHAKDYYKGDIGIHSHIVGDKIVTHHDHKIMEKVSNLFNKISTKNNLRTIHNERILNVKLLSFLSLEQEDSSTLSKVKKKTLFAYFDTPSELYHERFTPPPELMIV